MTEAAPGRVTDRAPYSAIVDRPPLRLPDGKRVALWVIVNVEHWAIERPMPRTVLPPPMGQPLLPDVPNWAWHEYGMRVGIWRLLDVLTRYGVRATLALNGHVCATYPRIVEAALDAGWEIMGHGHVQGPMHALEDQAAAIADAVEAIRRASGRGPRGWESPGLTETAETLDLLSAAGIDHVADWVMDDQPAWLRATPRPVLSIPYTVEVNDIVVYALQHAPPGTLEARAAAQFATLDAEGAGSARVMAVSVHPYLMGVPHRISEFDRLIGALAAAQGAQAMTASEIADWYAGAVLPAP